MVSFSKVLIPAALVAFAVAEKDVGAAFRKTSQSCTHAAQGNSGRYSSKGSVESCEKKCLKKKKCKGFSYSAKQKKCFFFVTKTCSKVLAKAEGDFTTLPGGEGCFESEGWCNYDKCTKENGLCPMDDLQNKDKRSQGPKESPAIFDDAATYDATMDAATYDATLDAAAYDATLDAATYDDAAAYDPANMDTFIPMPEYDDLPADAVFDDAMTWPCKEECNPCDECWKEATEHTACQDKCEDCYKCEELMTGQPEDAMPADPCEAACMPGNECVTSVDWTMVGPEEDPCKELWVACNECWEAQI